tara:strand:- start:116 stop:1243 length:1128 start_codon:yes stop_codon:yes gene_type:complete
MLYLKALVKIAFIEKRRVVTRHACAMGTVVPTRVKALLIGLLCVQNALYSLLRRYSQGVLHEKWNGASTLLFGEVVKLCVATYMFTREPRGTLRGLLRTLRWQSAYKMFVPAAIYFVMNLLSFYALKRIDAGVFTVLGQLKVLTTAVFTTVLIKRPVSLRQWRALFLLVLGCVLVLYEASIEKQPGSKSDVSLFGYVSGVGAMLIEVTLSGFASIWFEMVVKNKKQPKAVGGKKTEGGGSSSSNLEDGGSASPALVVEAAGPPSIWALNFQLSTWSILMYFPRTLLVGGHGAGLHALFDGWTINALIVSLLGAAGGLLVALSIKYTDSLVKSLAVGGAIVLTTFFGWLYLDGKMDLPVWIGCGCVILSMLNYRDG